MLDIGASALPRSVTIRVERRAGKVALKSLELRVGRPMMTGCRESEGRNAQKRAWCTHKVIDVV